MPSDLAAFVSKEITSDKGSFLIDRYWLLNADSSMFSVAENFMQDLIENNPDFQFYTSDDISGGIKIYWERRNQITEKN